MFCCFGSPLIDIIIETDTNLLKLNGFHENLAVRLDDNTEIVLKNLFASKEKTYKVGGSVTNTVRAFKKYSNNPLIYLGAVGKDFYADEIKKQLKCEQIEYNFLETNEETGKCYVLLTNFNRNRTLLTNLGASKHFSMTNLTKRDLELINNAKYYYFSCFLLTTAMDFIEYLCKMNEKTIFLNLGAPFLCEKYPQQVQFVCNYAKIIFGNEKEFEALSKLYEISSRNSQEKLLNLYKKLQIDIIVMTREQKSVYVVKNGIFHEFPVHPVAQQEISSCNGAGDVFVGGFLANYLQEPENIAKSTRFAIEIAGKFIKIGQL